MKKILIIDDDVDLLNMLSMFLKQNGYATSAAPSGRKGLKLLDESVDLILCDIKLPDHSGLDVLTKIKKVYPQIPVILITGYSEVSSAVEALRRGATDYVNKPLFPDEILLRIKEVIGRREQHPTEEVVKEEQSVTSHEPAASQYIEGDSNNMKVLNKNMHLVAPTDLTVMIVGETGSGKEFVARRLHELSERKNEAFVSLDCGALPPELAGSELFGHKKGAFTGAISDKVGHFELADGGTLFLDEVGNLSYENQIKLLRVLQERVVKPIGSTEEISVDFRLIVATNDDLLHKTQNGQFREDLFYRLNEFNLLVPPLRKRGEDIMQFAQHFLKLANQQLAKQVNGFSKPIELRFLAYSWPGNLRELNNVIKRAVLLCESSLISAKQIPPDMLTDSGNTTDFDLENVDLKAVAEQAEKQAIIQCLKRYQYNKTQVAMALNIDRKTLYNKIKAYGIEI